MPKLSVAILTYNEEKNIRDCLESVKWADEIWVLDERSTDKTVAIAKKYTSKIFFIDHGTTPGRTHDNDFHKRKQIVIDKCTGDWVLQIDADERVTAELAAEIKKTIKSPEFTGYEIPRRNIIFGKWIAHTGWYPDYQVKLFRQGCGKLATESYHEQIKVAGPIGRLRSDLLHEHYQTIEQFIDRLNRYTTNDTEFIKTKGESIVWPDALKFPADEFWKRFFLYEGYKDGVHGLVLSLLQAASRLVVFAKLWEKQGFFETDVDLREALIGKTKQLRKEWRHWLAATEKNPAKKLKYKILAKL